MNLKYYKIVIILIIIMSKIYKVPNHLTKKGIIISFHGGCFMGGNTSWDKEQNQMLSELGYEVHQVEFPKSHSEFCQWAKDYKLSSDLTMPLYCLGRSSGGYLAKIYSKLHQEINKTIYICPVFKPYHRCELKPQFINKTQKFFDSDPILTTDWDSNREILFLASNDQNIPMTCFTDEQLKDAIFLGPQSHSGMITTISKKFQDKLLNVLIG